MGLAGVLTGRVKKVTHHWPGSCVSNLQPFDLGRIEAPALLISVEDDRYGTFPGTQYTAAQIRRASFIGFRTGGHLWLGHRNEVSRAVRNFLQLVVQDESSAEKAGGTV
jgi:pimeloyl-ACP methyl ester carboxylesterase